VFCENVVRDRHVSDRRKVKLFFIGIDLDWRER
jgi:hypothetical protein